MMRICVVTSVALFPLIYFHNARVFQHVNLSCRDISSLNLYNILVFQNTNIENNSYTLETAPPSVLGLVVHVHHVW